MSDNLVISVDNVHKSFKLPKEKSNSLKSSIVRMGRREKGYILQEALRGISFEIEKGDFFGIVGRNGSGKSTLLKILAEIYQPTKGGVSHKGKIVPFIELGVGFNPELTGRENVYLNGAMLGLSRKHIDEKYDEIVKFAELEDFMDQRLKNYSSGMQVRLAFSVATRGNDADILLIDEVLAVGDADFQRKCYDYFKGIKKNPDVTVVFVTHDMSAVREYCNKAVLIEDGRVSCLGKPDTVADEYLKLFNHSSNAEEVEKLTNRWGSAEVTCSKFAAAFKVDDVVIDMSLTAKQTIEDVMVDIKFYNIDGYVVTGFNTVDVLGEGLSMKKGEVKKLAFRMPNTLGYQNYILDIEVTSTDGHRIYDKWKDAGRLTDNKIKTVRKYPVLMDVRSV